MARDATFYVRIAAGCQILTVTARSEEDAVAILESVVSAWASGEPVGIRGRAVRYGSTGEVTRDIVVNPAMVSSVGIDVWMPGVREW